MSLDKTVFLYIFLIGMQTRGIQYLERKMNMPLKILPIIFVLSFLLLGCNNDASPVKNTKFEQMSSEHSSNDTITNKQVANHLAKVAKKVPGVNDALSLVVGPYAIVGIDVEEQLDSARVGTIKYSVTEALRMDPYGKTAIVVADPDITERIRVMGEKMGEGHPTQAIFDEIASIVARTIPLFPKQEQPIEKDRNMEIDHEENSDLNKIQRKQSTENNDG